MTQSGDSAVHRQNPYFGCRDGASRSSDGRLDVKLSSPGALGSGTNPEQLFAAGWSSCFIGALKAEAAKMNLALPAEVAIDAEVIPGVSEGAYGSALALMRPCRGVEREVAQRLLDAAHQTCPVQRHARKHRSRHQVDWDPPGIRKATEVKDPNVSLGTREPTMAYSGFGIAQVGAMIDGLIRQRLPCRRSL